LKKKCENSLTLNLDDSIKNYNLTKAPGNRGKRKKMDKDEIRAIRKAIGINRKAFGRLVGVSSRHIEKCELGTRNPSKAVVMNINRIKFLHEKGALRI
jgi:DNA-binding transcriptional regulator YiaG